VAGTPTHGVLVSVSVSAVVYARILVSDRIGACPYRPFSNSDTINVTIMVCHIICFRSQMDSSFLTEPHCMYVELKIVSTKMRRLIVSFAINF